MKLPWISRSSHEAVVGLLTAHAADLREERKILLDRLATLGLGGPLFEVAEEAIPEMEPEDDGASNPDQQLLDDLLRFKHRPSKLADELSRQAYRQHSKRHARPKVAWVAQVEKIHAALDDAEKQGKRQVD